MADRQRLTVGGVAAHFVLRVGGRVKLSLGPGALETRLAPPEVLDPALRRINS